MVEGYVLFSDVVCEKDFTACDLNGWGLRNFRHFSSGSWRREEGSGIALGPAQKFMKINVLSSIEEAWAEAFPTEKGRDENVRTLYSQASPEWPVTGMGGL